METSPAYPFFFLLRLGFFDAFYKAARAIAMFEPKVEESKIGGKVKRYFVPETMTFFKRYIMDFNITGACQTLGLRRP